MPKSPDEIVAEIDRKQNEEDLQLPKRAWEAAKRLGSRVFQSDSEAFKELQEDAAKKREVGGIPVKKAKGGKVKSASARADGCCIRGKTRA